MRACKWTGYMSVTTYRPFTIMSGGKVSDLVRSLPTPEHTFCDGDQVGLT